MNEKYNITDDGMVEIEKGRYVNPSYISEKGLASAQYNTTPGERTVDRNALVSDFGAKIATSGPITSETLAGNTTPVTVPPTPPSTGATGLSGYASSYGESQKELQAQLDKQAEEARQTRDTEKQGLLDTMSQYLGIQTSRSKLEESAGLPEKQQKVTQYTNQLEALERAELNEIRALDNMPGTLEQRGQRTADIQRKYAFQKADVALLQSAANRDYETASNIVNRKIELQLEPLKTKLEFQKLFYDENKDLFNKAEQRQFDSLVKATEREYETEKANKTAIANIQLEALKNGVNIPQSVLTQLNTAKDAQEATAILARNGISLQNPLDIQLKREQLLTSQANRAKTSAEIDVLTGGQGLNTNISEVTGKPLTDTERTARGYADRAIGASGIIDNIGNQFTSFFSRIGQYAPNEAKSPARQQFEQAQRDFINAVLRRESGAAISESEFDNARKQYFPQPGDSKEVVAQKTQNRQRTIDGLNLSGGRKSTNQAVTPEDLRTKYNY